MEAACGTDSGVAAPLSGPVRRGHLPPADANSPTGTTGGVETPVPRRRPIDPYYADLLQTVDSPGYARRTR
jgi:hypothetical protein